MKDRSIRFNGEMIRAILDGRKTQTRRVIKPQPFEDYDEQPGHWYWNRCVDSFRPYDQPDWFMSACPFGFAGDKLWARETWATDYLHDNIKPSDLTELDSDIFYRADGKIDTASNAFVHRWRPSIHMPRWVSRITLDVKAIRVERVQDITLGNVLKEGCPQDDMDVLLMPQQEFEWFIRLWDSINAKRGFGWDTNPWVWVVEFEEMR